MAAYLTRQGFFNALSPYRPLQLSASNAWRCCSSPAFAIFEDSQEWWCSTERMGGNCFDFLCRYHQLSPSEMLKKLREGA